MREKEKLHFWLGNKYVLAELSETHQPNIFDRHNQIGLLVGVGALWRGKTNRLSGKPDIRQNAEAAKLRGPKLRREPYQ